MGSKSAIPIISATQAHFGALIEAVRSEPSGVQAEEFYPDFAQICKPRIDRLGGCETTGPSGVHSKRFPSRSLVAQPARAGKGAGGSEGKVEVEARKSGKTLLWGWVLYCHVRCNINTILRIGELVPKIDTWVTNAPLPAALQSFFGCATEKNSNKFRDRVSHLHGGVASSKRVAVKRVAAIALSPVKVHPQKKPRDFLKEMEAAGIKCGGNTHAGL
ncbi:hypothetical protein B0H16DRAFT_1452227 [Mycena metata]|uniref:Uncharacterized protein n=1 Tax=Mycena metata TaxID=1033252 RepID=A0AAD7JUH0_9AGAR|nr:hypothetical protein B0H16DRAFT_1452227 [Mycena metata]